MCVVIIRYNRVISESVMSHDVEQAPLANLAPRRTIRTGQQKILDTI